MKKIITTIGTMSFLFWFSAFPGAQQFFTQLKAAGTPFTTSTAKGFSANNGDPEVKLFSIMNHFPAPQSN